MIDIILYPWAMMNHAARSTINLCDVSVAISGRRHVDAKILARAQRFFRCLCFVPVFLIVFARTGWKSYLEMSINLKFENVKICFLILVKHS